MSIVLIRVDERLIHGQVVIGWGSQLLPERYVVVDDSLATSEWEQELYQLSVSRGTGLVFVTVEEARARLDRWKGDGRRTVILTRDLDTMLRLARDRRLEGQNVNLGGIHHREGRKQVRPYLYLNAQDREAIRGLEEEGVSVSARDLPGSVKVPSEDLMEDT